MEYIIPAAAGYLLGSLCFAIPLSRLLHHSDIRTHGSGNAGMTNTLRVFGWISAALVFAGDFLKGVAAVLLAQQLCPGAPAAPYIAALFAVVGHMFPLYFGFRGGKGVVTTAGTIAVLHPIVLAVLVGVWLALVLSTRIVSTGSIAAAAVYPIATALLPTSAPSGYALWLAIVTALLVIVKHKDNIKRLIAGNENRFGPPRKP